MITKQEILDIRKNFFTEIITIISKEPTNMDKFLNQERYYVAPLANEIYQNVEFGDLVIPIQGNFYGNEFKLWYSLWHIGERIKVGIALKEINLQEAVNLNYNKEISMLWGNDITPNADVARDMLLYDWEFLCPNFYTSYMHQEKFILGMRHMHFRLMKIISDKYHRIFNDSQIIEDADIKSLSGK